MFLSQFSRAARVPIRSLWSANGNKQNSFSRGLLYRYYTTDNQEINKEKKPAEPNTSNDKVPPLDENNIPNPEATKAQEQQNKKEENPVDEFTRRAQERLKREIEWEENDKKEKEERERRRRERQKLYTKINWGLFALSALGVSYLYYQGTLFDHLKRIDQKISTILFKLNNPTLGWKYALLPPSPVKHYTVVVDLEDLISIQYIQEKKVAKLRPYAELFLDELSELCEIVVWSTSQDFMAQEFVQQLQRTIPSFHFFLSYAECTQQYGRTIKDLGRLNRPLSNVVHLVHHPAQCAYQPENALYIVPWSGLESQAKDTTLLDAYIALRSIFTHYHPNSTDVRQLLTAYSSRDAAEANHREDLYPTLLQHHEGTKKRLAAMRRGAA